MGEPNAKKARVENQGGDNHEELDQAVLKEVEEIQRELDEIQRQSASEIILVEQRFVRLREPFYKKRAEKLSAIPGFWAKAFIKHPLIGGFITGECELLVSHLQSIEVTENEDIRSGYRIKFSFDENEFLDTREITKEFRFEENGQVIITTPAVRWKKHPEVNKNNQEPVFSQWLESNEPTDPQSDEVGEAIKDDLWGNPLIHYLAEESYEGSFESADDEEDEDEEEPGDEE